MSTRTQDKGKFVSPNELLEAAKDCYLEGKSPVTKRDWAMILNFVAANVSMAEESVCLIFKKIYNIPLDDEYVKEIARFQASDKLDRRTR